jgi:hypothetical protein
MKTIEMKALKVRAWELASGEWLVLVFMRTADVHLELLDEEYAPNEEAVKDAIRTAQERLLAVMKKAGFPDPKVRSEFAGAKKA